MTAKLKAFKGDTLLDEQTFTYTRGTTIETTFTPAVYGEIKLCLYGANLGMDKTNLVLQDTVTINIKKPSPAAVKNIKPVAKVVRTGKTKAEIKCVNATDYGMEVYRSTSKSGKYTLIKKATSSSYTDTKLSASKAYYYKIRMYAKSGSSVYYSLYSSPVKAEKYGIPMITLSFYNNKAVKVTWKAMPGADHYVVARNDDGGAGYYLVSEIKAPAVTLYDKKIESGKTYYYFVAGFTANGEDVNKYYGDQYKITIP
jgi:fibronectin type 3 domain-containing protein